MNGNQTINSHDPVDQERLRLNQERLGLEQGRLGEDQDGQKSSTPLSTAQLIIRRGLTTLAAVLILAAGTCLYFILPLPEVPRAAGANGTLQFNSTLHYTTPSSQTSLVMPV